VKPVIIHSHARAEMDEAMAFYEQQKAGLGLDLQTAVERAIGRIQ
jgi:toxin ParE1/3/4